MDMDPPLYSYTMINKQEFIQFMSESGVLRFGDFTLKSGRQAPYFINTGNYKTGAQLERLASFYADCIHDHHIEADLLFGPAYKGIPLVAGTAMAYYKKYGIDLPYCFDRKEAKDHGEGGLFVGAKPTDGDRLIIIEDVITGGTALRELLPKLYSHAAVEVKALIVSVNRMEKGSGDISAVKEIERDFGIPVYSIATIHDIIDAVKAGAIEGKEYLESLIAYRERYGTND